MDWDKEKECFKSLATEFSAFYSIQRDPFLLDNLLQQQSSEKEQLSLDDDGVQEGRDRILEGGENKHKVRVRDTSSVLGDRNDLHESLCSNAIIIRFLCVAVCLSVREMGVAISLKATESYRLQDRCHCGYLLLH